MNIIDSENIEKIQTSIINRDKSDNSPNSSNDPHKDYSHNSVPAASFSFRTEADNSTFVHKTLTHDHNDGTASTKKNKTNNLSQSVNTMNQTDDQNESEEPPVDNDFDAFILQNRESTSIHCNLSISRKRSKTQVYKISQRNSFV